MAENNALEGIEIPDNLLDSIAGGVLTDDDKDALRIMISAAKSGGYSLDDFIAGLVGFSINGQENAHFTAQEIWDYIFPIWDEL